MRVSRKQNISCNWLRDCIHPILAVWGLRGLFWLPGLVAEDGRSEFYFPIQSGRYPWVHAVPSGHVNILLPFIP